MPYQLETKLDNYLLDKLKGHTIEKVVLYGPIFYSNRVPRINEFISLGSLEEYRATKFIRVFKTEIFKITSITNKYNQKFILDSNSFNKNMPEIIEITIMPINSQNFSDIDVNEFVENWKGKSINDIELKMKMELK